MPVKLDDIDIELLPTRVADLVDVIGLQAALILVERYGGTSIWPPKQPKPDHPLCEAIGLQAFTELCWIYGGDRVEIDRCVDALRFIRERQIVREHEMGRSNAQLALHYGYTERGIRKLRRRVQERVPSINIDLFNDEL